MRRVVCFAIFTMFICSCVTPKNLITHGQVSPQYYTSTVAKFSITAPEGWHPTLTPPSPNTEQKLASQINRPKEIGYFVNTDGSAYIMIETDMLTLGGKPVHPVNLTFNDQGPVLFKKTCEERLDRQKAAAASAFSSFDYNCNLLYENDLCQTNSPCLEYTSKAVPKRPGEPILVEKVYVFGETPGEKYQKGAHGWRIHFTLVTPNESFEENTYALDKAIYNMTEIQ